MPKKVLLVGGGITSALIGNILRSDFENINLSLWEKLSEAGGRFNTITGGKNNELLVDLGAQSDKWNAVTETGKEELFDVVILTIPVPEILKLTGDLESLLFNNLVREHLSAVEYSSRFALGLFFDKGVFTEWDAEYIDDDSVLRYTANDSWKAHGEPKFKSAKVFKHWPEPSSTVICQWSYSQVFKPYYSKPGSVILNEKPLLIAGGDGFIGSTFDDCIFSAKTICNLLSNNYCGK
ncbi:renalase-like [Lycorma delicatula]|uniref:renalase-like n=1 Tax=Lycorma delicatula TaxID=130591 RepID=UPI003F51A167